MALKALKVPKMLERLRRLDRGLLAATVLALLAWLNPSVSITALRPQVLAVVDVSQSMDVADMPATEGPALRMAEPVSRLAATRSALRHALDELPCGARLGLAAFAEYRPLMLLMPVEVCANRAELLAVIDGMRSTLAWGGNSEVAKAVNGSLTALADGPQPPLLMFFTDGHEAPPVHPEHRPEIKARPGVVMGALVGVGQLTPQPIPKHDPSGRPLGNWRAEDVLQQDPRSRARGGTIDGNQVVDPTARLSPGALSSVGATPGTEHLSALREPYLQRLAGEAALAYHRLDGGAGVAAWVNDARALRPVPVDWGLRPLAALLALGCLLTRQWLRQRRAGAAGMRQRSDAAARAALGAGTAKPSAGLAPNAHPKTR